MSYYTQEMQDAKVARLQAEVPLYQRTIAQVREYLAKSQLTIDQLAYHTGYGGQTLDRFLQGRYHENPARSVKLVAAALTNFIVNNPAGQPEEELGRLYRTENFDTLEKWFDYCQKRGKMCCVYGPPGSQKTFAIQHIVADQRRAELTDGHRHHRSFYVYCSEGLTPLELVRKLLEAAALPACRSLQRNLAGLRFSLRERRTVFVFDEAQHLSVACLEIVRELNDLRPHFGVMLLGSHSLQARFTAKAAELEQWNSRITGSIELPGISNETAERIVREELGALADKPSKIAAMLDACMTVDIYSRKREKKYRSARKLFGTLEQIKEQAAHRAAGGLQ